MEFIKGKKLEEKIRAIYKERLLESDKTDLMEKSYLTADLLFDAGLLLEAKKIYLRLLNIDPEDETISQKLEDLNTFLN